MNKEEVYDEEIAPLMHEILRICKRNSIAAFATFAIPTPDDSTLQCTSRMLDEKLNSPRAHDQALAIILKGQEKLSSCSVDVLDKEYPA